MSAHGPGTLQVFSAPQFAFVERLVRVLLAIDFPMWLASYIPVQWPLILLGESRANLREARNLDIVKGILDGGFPPSDYKAGTINDIVQLAKLRGQVEWSLEDLKVPTLIMHGTHDIIVKFGAAKFHAERIPGARLIPYENGTHFFVSTHRQEVGQTLEKFMQN